MSDPVPSSGSRWKRRHFFATAALLLALVIAVPPFINVNSFRRSIVHSISAGLGRPVQASSVDLQLFPRPGFVLHNLSVGEDPAFGAEPVMTAATVTAGLRASTLWHARVEIATLRFDAPSVNLVRNAAGRWNFESLLRNSPALHQHATGASGKPTRKVPFPYVEATEARINFKLGAEKLPFSLEEANLALWKESAHEWRLRIRANPVRTDLTVRDAGQIRGEGKLTTGGALMNSPIHGSLEWRRVELDEIGRLLHGDDDGWRGTVDWTAEAKGTLADVALTSDIAIESFRRAEFMPASEMDLSAHCQGRYARRDSKLDSLVCAAPADGGQIWLRGFGALQPKSKEPTSGETNGAPQTSAHAHVAGGLDAELPRAETFKADLTPGYRPQVRILFEKVPAEFLLELLGHVHPGLAPDTSATGEVNGRAECAWRRLRLPGACRGSLRAAEVRLTLAHLDGPLVFSPVRMESASAADSILPLRTLWKLLPVRVPLGGAAAATVAGEMDSAGIALNVTGPADLRELSRLAQSLRMPAFSGEVKSLRGSAQLGLTLESGWRAGSDWSDVASGSGVAGALEPPASSATPVPSHWLGSVRLHNATLKLAALPVPLELSSGEIDLTPAGVEWTALNGTVAGIPFDGSVRWQTPCPASSSPCARSFDLYSANLSAERLQAALRNRGGSGLLDQINPWADGLPPLPTISGTVRADILSVGPITLKDAELQLRLKGKSAGLVAITGKVFGGAVTGRVEGGATPADGGSGWVRWGDGAPAYELRVSLEKIQPDDVGALWQQRWGGGVADAAIDLKTQGWSVGELARNAKGKFALDWVNGTLASATGPAIHFERWKAKGTIGNRRLVLDGSRLVPRGVLRGRRLSRAVQSVTGTVMFGRDLDLQLTPSGVSLHGPLGMSAGKSPVRSNKPS